MQYHTTHHTVRLLYVTSCHIFTVVENCKPGIVLATLAHNIDRWLACKSLAGYLNFSSSSSYRNFMKSDRFSRLQHMFAKIHSRPEEKGHHQHISSRGEEKALAAALCISFCVHHYVMYSSTSYTYCTHTSHSSETSDYTVPLR